ncbi:MAG: tetratricopeptide repeat protein [Haliscomenobacter sp.]
MKNKAFPSYLLLVVLFFFGACSPKTGEQAATTPPAPTPAPVPAKKEGPCRTFKDAPLPDDALRNFVLYRDFLKAEDWDQAYALWQKVYAEAPAADGQRNTVFADGIRFNERFLEQTTDSIQREKIVDQIFKLYDEIDQCYPEGGYVPARKAFDLYYAYPHRASRKEIYDLFKLAVDKDGLKTADFVINPFSSLLVEMYFEQKISLGEAQKYQQTIRNILANGLKTCEGRACERWKVVESYAPSRLEAFETVKGFYDCSYYMDRFYSDFLNDSTNCDVLREVYSRLKWGGCLESDPRFARLIAVGNANCAPEKGPVEIAYNCLRDADYNCAIEGFEKAAESSDDPVKKGQYLLLVSKIYNANLKNFAQSRKYALRAAAAYPNWGEPFIQIGRLYASSGPLCGPGRGWDSQIVVWAAIDMWNRAKSVDPASAAEANRWINRYAQYMPTREDVFLRNLKTGDRFYIGCWIQEYTTIRTSD